MKNKYLPTRKDIAFSQIFLLAISIVAFTWAIGSEIQEVSGLQCTRDAPCSETDLFGQKSTCPYCKYYRDDGKIIKRDSSNALRPQISILSGAESSKVNTAMNGLMTGVEFVASQRAQAPA